MADRVILTSADTIVMRRPRWLWDKRVPTIGLSLLAGREGVGKSTTDCWLAAAVTTGALPGEYQGTPRNILYIASEDDWETTLAPRLVAAGADMARVFKMALCRDGSAREGQVELPEDLDAFEAALEEVEPALVVVSPLMSRVSGTLDSHKDQQVRQALEPLVEIAFKRRVCILGLIHLNKSDTTDPLRAIMSSAAFVAVARAVLFVARDPDEPEVRVLGQPKNNGGPSGAELGLLTFTIEPVVVGSDPDDGLPIEATRLVWGTTRDGSIEEVLADSQVGADTRTATNEAGEWLTTFLREQGGSATRDEIIKEAKALGFAESAITRARTRYRITSERTQTMPSKTIWKLPGPQSVRTPTYSQGTPSTSSARSTQSTPSTGTGRTTVHRVRRSRPGEVAS